MRAAPSDPGRYQPALRQARMRAPDTNTIAGLTPAEPANTRGETTRIARGRGMLAPNVRHASVYRLRSSAFMGLPWPKNAVDMGWSVIEVDSLLRGPFDRASLHADLAHQAVWS